MPEISSVRGDRVAGSSEVDSVDRVLLDALQADATRRLDQLGTLVGLAPSSVHERLRRLERAGILRRWTVDVDVTALGVGVLAYIGLRATRPCSELIDALSALHAVEESHSVAGELSMLLKVRVAGTHELLELVEQLRLIPGVEGTETTIVLRTHFDRPIPVSSPGPAPVRRARR